MRRQKGFTLVEIATILLALSILSAILLPEINTFLVKAKVVRAKEDVAAIGVGLQRMLEDTGECAVWANGNNNVGVGDTAAAGTTAGPSRTDTSRIDLLFGDGDVPDLAIVTPLDHTGATDATSGVWHEVGTPGTATTLGGTMDTIGNILVSNAPSSDPTAHYRYPSDMIIDNNYVPDANQAYNQAFGWRGPYLNEATADPWGNRYTVNTRWLDCVNNSVAGPSTNDGLDGGDFDTMVISAGANEQVNTPFTTKGGSTGATTGGYDDDIVFVMSGGAVRK